MLIWIDRAFAVVLLLGACGHVHGSFAGAPWGSGLLVWSLSGSLAAMLTGVLNWLRAGRPDDGPLAWITFVASVCWVAIAIAFGNTIGNVFDFRVVWHTLAAAGLAAFSANTLARQR